MDRAETGPGKKNGGKGGHDTPPRPGTKGWGVYFVVLIVVLAGIALAYYIKQHSPLEDEDTITLYGFSVKGEVFDDKVIPAFRDHWLEMTGEVVRFETVYEGSGSITKKALSGAPAEVMVLSTEWDAIQLRKGGVVSTDWNDFPHNGVVSKSPWVILTRGSNPLGIEDFGDLTASKIEIVHADPLTSGGASWSVFAMYGSVLIRSEAVSGVQDTAGAEDLLEGVIDNVISWQSSARKALSQFTLGYGDAFITYESEGLLAIEKGEDFTMVYPHSTIYSEHKVVLVDENVRSSERAVVEEFIDFLFTDEVQGYMADYGFRSIDDVINSRHEEFPRIHLPFTVDYLGGWEQAHEDVIEGVFRDLRE
jgi:sulfate transport system substrate-binding protein